MKWQRFTERSRLAMVKAQEEAKGLQCPYTSPEHLLLGLLSVGGVGSAALQELGVSSAQVRNEIALRVGNANLPSGLDIDRTVGYRTPAMLQVLELAAKESSLMKLTYIGTEHLLLALLCVEDGLAAQVLADQGLELAKARAWVKAHSQLDRAGDDDENSQG